MSVTQIAEKDQGPRRQKFPGPRVPPNLFGIALGTDMQRTVKAGLGALSFSGQS
jgi:hypothetical protein